MVVTTNIEIGSSHGTIIVDKRGIPVHWRLDTTDLSAARHLLSIIRFNLAEWVECWEEEMPGHLDILDVGYYYADTVSSRREKHYCEPEEEHREEIRRCKKSVIVKPEEAV
jgi:hypothetical protein